MVLTTAAKAKKVIPPAPLVAVCRGGVRRQPRCHVRVVLLVRAAASLSRVLLSIAQYLPPPSPKENTLTHTESAANRINEHASVKRTRACFAFHAVGSLSERRAISAPSRRHAVYASAEPSPSRREAARAAAWLSRTPSQSSHLGSAETGGA